MTRMTRKERTKIGLFPCFVLLLTIFCIMATAAGWLRVSHMAAAYDQSLPERAMRSTLELFQRQDAAAILAAGDFPLSPFENEQIFADCLRAYSGGETPRLTRKDAQTYQIVAGSRPLATVTLTRHTDGAYGFDRWEVQTLTPELPRQPDLLIDVPAGIHPLVNGRPLSAADLENDAIAVEEYGTLPKDVLPPLLSRYRVPNLLAEPTITAEGTEKTVVNGRVILSTMPDAATVTQLTAIAQSASKAYANYITNDAAQSAVTPYFLPGTTFYTHLRQFYNAWYNAHDSFSFSDMTVKNWAALDDSHVSCEISFDYTIRMGRHTFEYPSNYSLYFIRVNNVWKISNLLVR